MDGFWHYGFRFSLLGHAALFVVLLGGSHASTAAQLYPHKPVHLERKLSVRLDLSVHILEIHDAQQAWDDAVGENIITNQGSSTGLPFDAIIADADQGEAVVVPLRAHNGQETTRTEFGPPPNAVAISLSAEDSGVDQAMKIVILETSSYVVRSTGNRWRTVTHEFGHVLGLGDHSESYAGMMDNREPVDDWPADFQIQNYPFENYPDFPLIELFPDEASCVRLLFDIPGKQLCAPD